MCVCLIFHVFRFSHHIPGPIVCVFHFPRFSVFSPYSRSYREYFSFSTFFNVSRHIPGSAVYVAHFARFSVFLAIFQVLQCAFLIFHVFQ